MRKSTFDTITDEACDKLLLDLEVKSCVDANTMDNVMPLIIPYQSVYNLKPFFIFILAYYFYGTSKGQVASALPRGHSPH